MAILAAPLGCAGSAAHPSTSASKWVLAMRCRKNPRICRMQQTKSGLFATYSTGRMLSLTPGTQKLPHPNGTQGCPRPSRSYHCKAFPKPLRAGFWLAAILTRSERGANEVQIILGDWPRKSPDKVFGSHTLSQSFQNSKTQELSAVEQKRKPSQAAAAGKSKETEEKT